MTISDEDLPSRQRNATAVGVWLYYYGRVLPSTTTVDGRPRDDDGGGGDVIVDGAAN